jgi:CBS-domain-containing membrane protein
MTTQSQRRYARRLTWIAAQLAANAIIAAAAWVFVVAGALSIIAATATTYALVAGVDKPPAYWPILFLGGNVFNAFVGLMHDLLCKRTRQ